jgi:predicted small secreted protein
MAWRISAIVVTLALLGGCNTMHGMGQDFDSVFGTNLSGDKNSSSASTSGGSATGSTSASSGNSGSTGNAGH